MDAPEDVYADLSTENPAQAAALKAGTVVATILPLGVILRALATHAAAAIVSLNSDKDQDNNFLPLYDKLAAVDGEPRYLCVMALCARLIDVIAEAENDVLLRSTEDNGKT